MMASTRSSSLSSPTPSPMRQSEASERPADMRMVARQRGQLVELTNARQVVWNAQLKSMPPDDFSEGRR